MLAVRAEVTLRAVVFLPPVRASLAPHHSRSVVARPFQRTRFLKLRVPRCALGRLECRSFARTFSSLPVKFCLDFQKDGCRCRQTSLLSGCGVFGRY